MRRPLMLGLLAVGLLVLIIAGVLFVPPLLRPRAPADVATALAYARAGVQRNADWYSDGFVQRFDDVPMVLVPAGCFTMGNDAESTYMDDTDAGFYVEGVAVDGERQCFTEPFWIDQTETTQAQFERFNGVAEERSTFTGENFPVDRLAWGEALAYCQQRGNAFRLPTEAEWEYAARGPDALFYPWGHGFSADNLVYSENSDGQTARVGSRVGGASWVGALDMSGNVWEWTLSDFRPYPYVADDGRNDTASGNAFRVRRGGSWGEVGSFLRSASRIYGGTFHPMIDTGVRCLRAAD